MRRGVAALAAGTALALALTGCAPTVALSPAPQATAVGCASVVVRLVGQPIGALQPRNTDAQGTFAWGDPLAVTLYCGVSLHPSADPCYVYDGVDWKVADQTSSGSRLEVYTTVGRAPIVQFVVDTRYGNAQDALPVISDAVASATRRSGLGCTTPSAPSPTPSPTP